MRLRYRPHARDQMRHRKVTETDIEWALRHWMDRSEDSVKNSVRYRGKAPDGRVLRVWVFPDGDPRNDKTVKSVAWEDEE